MKRCVLALLLVCGLSFGAHAIVQPPDNQPKHGKKLWWASVVALGAASALDMQSSWGKPELNPLLRGSDGRFGARGAAIKLSITGAVVGFQWLVLKRHPTAEKAAAVMNAGVAGWIGATAAHNYAIERVAKE